MNIYKLSERHQELEGHPIRIQHMTTRDFIEEGRNMQQEMNSIKIKLNSIFKDMSISGLKNVSENIKNPTILHLISVIIEDKKVEQSGLSREEYYMDIAEEHYGDFYNDEDDYSYNDFEETWGYDIPYVQSHPGVDATGNPSGVFTDIHQY